ncbi:MAG: 4-carboxy-4-hydroxy-2-oxoadipate aldolase/oxaloacetate decarboxylase [Acidobacteriota bacterium]|nr:4-carboxy-4-hydroxy-2-oxoadipate aldolase/oxaloacetate decarboxylase [Acidobacteriota bacterium]
MNASAYKMGTVVRTIPRATPEQLQELAAAGVATVHEAMGRTGLMQPYLRPVYRGARVAGNAITVLAHPGDNWMIHVAVELCQPGDVLVVAVSAENHDGMFGELLATSLRSRGVAGLVIDAGVRDVAELTAMQFPAWSRCISAKGTIKATLGMVNTPVVCAGALVCGGDVVVADDDGVAIVPHRSVEPCLQAVRRRLAREEGKRARLAAGELGMDIEEMRPTLAALGLRYYDTLDEVEP